MKLKKRSTLIKGRILASVITFILLIVFLIIASQMGLFGNQDQNNSEQSLQPLGSQAHTLG